MKTIPILLICASTVAGIGFPRQSFAGFVFEFENSSPSIVQGTAQASFNLRLRGTETDVGASFDAFTYSIAATATGSTTGFTATGNSSRLGGLVTQGWNVVDMSPNALTRFGNVNAPGGSGASLSLPQSVMSFTIDTSSLVAGNSIAFDLNANFRAAASLGGVGYAVSVTPATLSVTSVPEPSSAAVLGLTMTCVLARRRRSVA